MLITKEYVLHHLNSTFKLPETTKNIL